MRSHLHAYARRIYATSFPYRYWTLSLLALSSSLHASYAISVRRASVLPAASFRFHLAMDTLAVRLTIPPVGFVGDFHSLVRAPCRAHQTKIGGIRQSQTFIFDAHFQLTIILRPRDFDLAPGFQ